MRGAGSPGRGAAAARCGAPVLPSSLYQRSHRYIRTLLEQPHNIIRQPIPKLTANGSCGYNLNLYGKPCAQSRSTEWPCTCSDWFARVRTAVLIHTRRGVKPALGARGAAHGSVRHAPFLSPALSGRQVSDLPRHEEPVAPVC